MSPFRRMIKRRFSRMSDRGVALVEMALVAPFLTLVAAGVMEYGLLWRDSLTLTSSTRAAARIVSNLGDDVVADREALISLSAGLADTSNFTIEGVLIYDATGQADGEPPAACFDASDDPVAVSGLCNVYAAADLLDLESGRFDACTGSSPITDFCPTARNSDQASGVALTSVGIWVRIQRDYVTGLFPGDGVTIEDHTVMRVEPSL